MSKIVVADGRSTAYTRGINKKSWKVLVEFKATYQPLNSIPDSIRKQYLLHRQNGSFLYIGFEGLTPDEAIMITHLSQSGKARMSVNRWGDIAGYYLILES